MFCERAGAVGRVVLEGSDGVIGVQRRQERQGAERDARGVLARPGGLVGGKLMGGLGGILFMMAVLIDKELLLEQLEDSDRERERPRPRWLGYSSSPPAGGMIKCA